MEPVTQPDAPVQPDVPGSARLPDGDDVPGSAPQASAPRSQATAADAVSGTEPQLDLTGQTLGDFQILRRLGQGGMGQVYLAEQISLKRKVALKLLKSDLAANKTSLERFKQEALSVARATHANIVQVYFIGEEKGLHYMALEYVEGRNLREYLEKKGPPEVFLALSIIRQVAAALQRASEFGIIHRDIKPENILLTRKGEVKVADFGLSRCFADHSAPLNLTQSGVAMGTPLYMSPEQVEGKPVDPRTDIYSFGVTCYHMLGGRPPFRGNSPFEVAYQHVQKEPEPLAVVRPDLPPELCALVHKMMAKKPEDRFPTAREIVKEVSRLRDALVGASGSTAPALAGSGVMAAPALVPASLPDASSPVPIARPGRWLWVGGVGIVLALAGGLALGWLRNQTPGAATTDDGNSVKPVSQREREKELVQLIKDSTENSSRLTYSIELGLLYLKDQRYDDAEQFFKQVEQKKDALRQLGTLGQAMVLAFRDKHEESNKMFQRFFTPPGKALKDKKLFLGGLMPAMLNNASLREMMGHALHHNWVNSPSTFPASLEPYRRPPEPVLRPPANPK